MTDDQKQEKIVTDLYPTLSWVVVCPLDTSWAHLRGEGLNFENAFIRLDYGQACAVFS